MQYQLPSYPCFQDLWDKLAKESRPIVVYGMGNGADKLICRFERYGIKIADFFASDGFVRGHSFHGYRVKSFSEIKESYPDFVIVLSFASNRKEVLEMLIELDGKYEMYVPDMPVADVEEYFDREFYNANYEKICEAYDRLEDEESKRIYAAIVNYKLSGKMNFLMDAYNERDGIYSLFRREEIENIIDAGAYNGDTIREAKCYFSNLKSVIAIEPDRRNFKKLERYSEAESETAVKCINSGAWSQNTEGSFSDSGNRNSTVTATASYQHKETTVSLVRIDSLTNEKIDYIKFDVEGAESEALIGADGVITAHKPDMLVSLYHRSCDLFMLTNTLGERYPWYKMYLRRQKCVPAWEIDLILVRED